MRYYSSEVIMGELKGGESLDHVSRVVEDIYAPLFSKLGPEAGCPDIVAREIQDHVQGFSANLQILTGYIAGETCLPLPPIVDENVPERTSGQRDDFLMRNKERVHAMESCLITWTKQIRSVLQMDPERYFS